VIRTGRDVCALAKKRWGQRVLLRHHHPKSGCTEQCGVGEQRSDADEQKPLMTEGFGSNSKDIFLIALDLCRRQIANRHDRDHDLYHRRDQNGGQDRAAQIPCGITHLVDRRSSIALGISSKPS
jgi:hypothetical protein